MLNSIINIYRSLNALNLFASRYRADIINWPHSRPQISTMFSLADAIVEQPVYLCQCSNILYEIRKRYRRPWKPAKERCNRDKFFLGPRPRVRKPHKHAPRFFFLRSCRFFCISISSHTSYVTLCAVTNARSMTSNAIRGIRRKKSSLCEVKVAVIGAPGVGKSGEYYVLSRILLHLFAALSFASGRNECLPLFFLIKI